MLSKVSLRQEMLKMRRRQSPADRRQKSESIIQKIEFADFYKKAVNILFYFPMDSEANLFPLAEKALMEEKHIFFPFIDSEDDTLKVSEVKDLMNDLERGFWKMKEPKKKRSVDPAALDLFFVPGVAFDIYGNRLGMGKGYFDSFFTRQEIHDPHGFHKRIGIAFDFQIVQEVPVTKDDQRVSKVVTEKEIYECKGSSEKLKN